MAITFIHGDNQAASRQKLLELKKKAASQNNEIIPLDGNTVFLDKIIQSLEAQSLFADKKMVTIENLFSSKKNNIPIIDYLKNKNNDSEAEIILWENQKIDGRKIIWLKNKGKVEEFSYPQVLFSFLDAVFLPDKEKILELFDQTVKNQPVELVYFMIVRQLRLILLARANSLETGLKETSRLQNWQKKKLQVTAAKFDFAKLRKIYQNLMLIDYQQKTGRAALDLKQTLDIFLINMYDEII